MSSFRVEKPEEIVFTLTMTMKLKDWLTLEKQLQHGAGVISEWPASDFISEIRDMATQAKRELFPNV